MTDIQLYLAIGAPVVLNAVVSLLIVTMMNTRVSELSLHLNSRLNDQTRSLADLDVRARVIAEGFAILDQRFINLDRRFDAITQQLEAVNGRFDDMRSSWIAELHRVEEVFDARLKHLEERTRS